MIELELEQLHNLISLRLNGGEVSKKEIKELLPSLKGAIHKINYLYSEIQALERSKRDLSGKYLQLRTNTFINRKNNAKIMEENNELKKNITDNL